MRFLILILFSGFIQADIQICLDKYNGAIVERNNAVGAFKIAKSQKESADGKIEKWERKKFIQGAKESAIHAIDLIAKSQALLDQVKAECIQSFVEKATELSAKNLSDLSDYEAFKKDMDLTLQLPR